MYLVVIGWVYVAMMMAVAEASSSQGSLLGGMMTFVLYGMVPVALVVYLMRAPARNKALKNRRAEELAQHHALAGNLPEIPATPSVAPDSSSHTASGAEAVATNARIAPVRKEP